MEYVKRLSELRRGHVALAGGKGASLGELIAIGASVPPGFCVTTQAYETFVSEAGIGTTLGQLLDSPPGDEGKLAAAMERIRQGFEPTLIPQAIRDEVADAYTALGSPAVAVRSSASAEDLPEASFAGQHETVLNVKDLSRLLTAIAACWASLWTPAAAQYRVQQGYGIGGSHMAVVVQQMLAPTTSGVLYTADPITGDRGYVVINGTYGLGETVVSGLVTPDVYRVRKGSGEVTGIAVSPKASISVALDDGGTETRSLPREVADVPCLTEEQAGALAQLGEKIEAHYGMPLDIEWSIAGDALHVLQARPLTALPAPRDAELWQNPVAGARWRRTWRIGEWLSDPVTPLFSTSLLPVLVAGREEQGFNHLGWSMRKSFEMPKPWYCIVNGFFFTRADPPFRMPAGQVDVAERAQMLTGNMQVYEQWRDVHLPSYLERLDGLRAFDVALAGPHEILEYLERLALDAGEWWYLQAPIGYAFEEMFFRAFYESHFDDPDRPHFTSFFKGFDSLPLEGARRLHALAQQIKGIPALRSLFLQEEAASIAAALASNAGGEAVLRDLEQFRSDYGHQLFSFDFYFASMGERPELAVTLLRSHVLGDVPDPAETLAEQRRERERAMEYARSEPQRLSPDEAGTFTRLLDWHQLCASLREDIPFHQQKLWPLMRGAVMELGRRLAEAGVLDSSELVFFLHRDEIVASFDDSGTALPGLSRTADLRERKRHWERQRELSPPDRMPGADDPVWREGMGLRIGAYGLHSDEGRRRLVGHGASPGRVTAPARVLHSPSDMASFRPGEVLVTVSAAPAWTALFPMAAAVVTEIGGGASHSSMVAREYNIPAVMATGVATQEIRNGQTVTVDGTEGVVYLG